MSAERGFDQLELFAAAAAAPSVPPSAPAPVASGVRHKAGDGTQAERGAPRRRRYVPEWEREHRRLSAWRREQRRADGEPWSVNECWPGYRASLAKWRAILAAERESASRAEQTGTSANEEAAMEDRERITLALVREGITAKDWKDTEEDGLVAVLGRFRVTTDDEEDRGFYDGDEGELTACVVGAAQYGNQRVTFSFTGDGFDVGLEVPGSVHDLLEPTD